MKKILSTLALAIITASAAFAGTDSKKVVIAPVQEDLFRAGEIQIDASFAALLGRYNGRNANGIGGNLGLNYFITRYIGIGVDNTVGGWVGSGNNGAFDNLQATSSSATRSKACTSLLTPSSAAARPGAAIVARATATSAVASSIALNPQHRHLR